VEEIVRIVGEAVRCSRSSAMVISTEVRMPGCTYASSCPVLVRRMEPVLDHLLPSS
jgi:hypothetical protein